MQKGKEAPMASRISGPLMRVLRVSRVAWYRGDDGTCGYYEQPSMDAPGQVVVNGKRITKLVVDAEGLYLDRPSPKVQHMMIEHGLDLDHGWTCKEEVYGAHINEAMRQSRSQAVRHHKGHISVQKLDEHQAIIFVNGRKYWTGKITSAHHVLEELDVETWDGWYPLQHDLLEVNESGYRYRRELI